MSARFVKGQKVVVRAIKTHNSLSTRDYALEKYEGQIGTVDNYYYITMGSGNTVYLYVVRIERDRKAIVLYEDEMQEHKVQSSTYL
jgi:hypothetical protein